MKRFKKGSIILWAVSLMFFITSFSFIADGDFSSFLIGVLLSFGLAFWGYRKHKKFSISKPNDVFNLEIIDKDKADKQTTFKRSDSDFEYLELKVKGVTFKTGRKSRQTMLRKIKYREDEFANELHAELRECLFEGNPAFGVYVNDNMIGNIPSTLVPWLKDNYNRYVCVDDISVYGGYNDKSFGASINLKLRKL